MSLTDEIPGLAAEMEREQTVRAASLLDTIILCGLPCRQLSIRTYTLLKGAGNPFIVPSVVPSPQDVAVFLWLHALDYEAGNERARLRWVRRNVRPLISGGKYPWCVAEINRHIENTFMDSPGPGRYDGKEYFLGSAGLIDLIASEYGWSDEYIMGLPISRLFQYQRAMRKRYDPRAALSNPSDRLISEHLQERSRIAQGGN